MSGVNVNLRMTPRLLERMDSSAGARGLSRHDFIVHSVEREISQIEARLVRREREAREARRASEAHQG